MKKLICTLVILSSTVIYSQQSFYPVTPGSGNGIKFWNSDSYKIHMGNSTEYKFGPVTDFSIKMNMNNTVGRGWTWGVAGLTPIAGLNTRGNMEIAGYFKAKQSISVNKNGSYRVELNGQGDGYVSGRNDDTENKFLIHSSGNSYFNGGSVGIGTDKPNSKLHLSGGNNDVELTIEADTNNNDEMNNPFIRLAQDGGSVNGFIGLVGDLNTAPHVEKYKRYENVLGTWVQKADYPGTLSNYMLIGMNNGEGVQLGANGNVRLTVHPNGNVGIGTNNPDSKLTVKGKIHAEEMRLDLSVPGPDYVFANDYELPTLEALQNYIQKNKHLPNIPSAKEMEANGIELGIMNMKLLEKIEELTLYTLEQEEKFKEQKAVNKKLEERLSKLEQLLVKDEKAKK